MVNWIPLGIAVVAVLAVIAILFSASSKKTTGRAGRLFLYKKI